MVRKLKLIMGLVLLIGSGLSLRACLGHESPVDLLEIPARKEKAELSTQSVAPVVVGLARAPQSLDPADYRDRTSETVLRNIFDGLVTRDTRTGIHLELAKKLTWQDDRTLRIDLRQGVLFHDGVEMTAEDVVFTFDRIIQDKGIEYPEPHTSPRRSLITPLESIEQLDRYGVLMHFRSPWPAALQMLVHQQIVPKHYLESVGTAGFIARPVGTGPFEFVSATSDLREIVLTRFVDYYGGAPDLIPPELRADDANSQDAHPINTKLVQQVTFRVVPDAHTLAAGLAVGELDIIQTVPPYLRRQLARNPRVQVKTAPGTQPQWMELNVNHPPFDDARVRQALNYAVDKQRIIEEVYEGLAVPLPGPLSPFNNFVNQDLEPYPYAPEKALALLSEAGWVDRDGDGFLDGADDEPLEFVLDTLQDAHVLALAIADQLREVGVKVSVRVWEFDALEPELLAGRRVAYLGDWGDSAFDPIGYLEAKCYSRTAARPYYGRGNYSGYTNVRVDALIRLGELTTDPVKRQEIYDEAQEVIYEEAPAVFLVLPEQIAAASVNVRNWEPASDGRINLHYIYVMP